MRVKIRGKIYETEREAASAFGVSIAYINRMLDLGKEDRIGLGIGKGRPAKSDDPFKIGNLTFANKREASMLLGFRPNRVSEITSKGSKEGMAALERAAAAYELARRTEK